MNHSGVCCSFSSETKAWTFTPTAFLPPPVPSLSINTPPYKLSDHIFHLEHEVLKIWSSNSGQHLIYDWNKNLSGQFLMLTERQQNLHSGTVAILAVNCTCGSWFYPLKQSRRKKFNEWCSWTKPLMLYFIVLKTGLSNPMWKWWKVTAAPMYYLPSAQL